VISEDIKKSPFWLCRNSLKSEEREAVLLQKFIIRIQSKKEEIKSKVLLLKYSQLFISEFHQ
jgi:hypothetical protein